MSRGDVIYTVGSSAEDRCNSCRCRRRRARSSRWTRRTARWSPWSAASISSRANTTASPKPGASRAPASSPSSTRRRSTRATRRRAWCWMRPSCSTKPGWSRPGGRRRMRTRFDGPMRLREAMAHSINLVSVRLMREIGADYTWNYVQRFGFDKSQLPQDLTMALGTAELSPLQVATAYSTFANGGFRVTPTTSTASRMPAARRCLRRTASPAPSAAMPAIRRRHAARRADGGRRIGGAQRAHGAARRGRARRQDR